MSNLPKLCFGVIGIDHRHVYDQTNGLLNIGAQCVGYWNEERELTTLKGFEERFPHIPRIHDRTQLLEDKNIQLITSAAIPSERAGLAIEAMRYGKDFMADKPGMTTLGGLEEVQRVRAETGRIYTVNFTERFEVPAVTKATELIRQGAIGRVLQTIGLGPHRLNRHLRPQWFFDRASYGGILADIGSHQIDQFLHFTGSTDARIVKSRVGNIGHPDDPGLDDFGEMMLSSDSASAYIRVDWFTPDGLDTWGDGRLTILGTEGYIELRKYIDISGRPGKDHLFMVNNKGSYYFDCAKEPLPYYENLWYDIVNRTETAMTHRHCFKVCELALRAQKEAERIVP